MSRVVENPKKHVLSFRVDDAEWKLLKKASRSTGTDISTLLRQSLRDVLDVGGKRCHGACRTASVGESR